MMDTLGALAEHFDLAADEDEESAMEIPPEIGFDERRMHVRAYNYWVSLLNGRAYPSIEDLEPDDLDDFGPHSVLLDFTTGPDNPAIAFLGRQIREQCGLGRDISTISQVPSRSLLSRLTDHYLQIIANRAPIGFEAEFVSDKGSTTTYRGILMPLSSDGQTIDFIYGVINWKELADAATTHAISEQMNGSSQPGPAEASPVWADGPASMPDTAQLLATAEEALEKTLELGIEQQCGDAEEETSVLELALDQSAGLADRLSLARESADAARSADRRSRAALYAVLGQAYDFALAAETEPELYAELLEDAGLKAQQRAPMTPVVKLIFGVDYDKTRLTEFAAALSYGRRQNLGAGELKPLLETFEGGLKGIVQAERRARRPEPAEKKSDAARLVLRSAAPLARLDIAATDGEFVLLVARREADGALAVVAPVEADEGLLDRAIRKSILR